LATRTFAASPGSSSEGSYGYEYRTDLANVTGTTGLNCIDAFPHQARCAVGDPPPVPEQIDVGIGLCPTNMPCKELPDFASSGDMALYRRKGYESSSSSMGLNPRIVAIEGLGVPAIEHGLGGLLAIEMAIGQKKLAYVETWAPPATARALAEKVLARAR
jgi:hypothetical protein